MSEPDGGAREIEVAYETLQVLSLKILSQLFPDAAFLVLIAVPPEGGNAPGVWSSGSFTNIPPKVAQSLLGELAAAYAQQAYGFAQGALQKEKMN